MASAEHPAFDHFTDTVAQLRDPDTGCPWNRAQTHESLGDYLIEEAYEALDAIQQGDADHLREELGDVLLQVVLHSQVAADSGEFTIDDVCKTIDDKMIRRHPHVFGDAKAANANEVSQLWEQVKLAEKQRAQADRAADNSAAGNEGADECPGLLDDVPTHFPALLQAQKISRRAAAAGFEWDTIQDIWLKVEEERGELQEAYDVAPKTADGKMLFPDELSADAEMEFGDLLFALVNVARRMGIDAEAALRASNAKFRKRFGQIEQEARRQGRRLEELDILQMEEAWQRAKQAESAPATPHAQDAKEADSHGSADGE